MQEDLLINSSTIKILSTLLTNSSVNVLFALETDPLSVFFLKRKWAQTILNLHFETFALNKFGVTKIIFKMAEVYYKIELK